MTRFWCPSDFLITSCWLTTARWSTWPGNHLVACVADLVGSCVAIHAYRCLPDPKCLFYLSALSLCLSVDHFYLVPIDDMVLFNSINFSGWFPGHVLHRAHSRDTPRGGLWITYQIKSKSCRQLADPHSTTGHFQWRPHVPGTPCQLVSGRRCHWPASVSSWKQHFSRLPTHNICTVSLQQFAVIVSL